MAPASLKRKLSLAFDTRTKKAPPRRAPKQKPTATKKKQVVRKVKPDPASAQQHVLNLKSEPLPVATAPLKPKVEYSPNGMARCQGCKKKIQKEHKRFGIPEHCARYNKEIYRYYHARCCPNRYQDMVPDAVGQLARQKQLLKDKDRIVEERQGLYNDLKKLRLLFANRLEVSFFLVFNNEVLKELVVQMPTTPSELLSIHGIGEAKLKSFGDPILQLIRQHKMKMKQASASVRDKKPTMRPKLEKKGQNVSRKKAPVPAEIIPIDLDDDDDDDQLVMGATLTCEQLVQQKFEHAAKNGYMITVD